MVPRGKVMLSGPLFLFPFLSPLKPSRYYYLLYGSHQRPMPFALVVLIIFSKDIILFIVWLYTCGELV